MNRNDFISLIQDPEKVNPLNITEIKELIELFPYFQTAHLLLLKGLHNSSDIRFAGQLTSSSVHIASREVLYYLLNSISGKENSDDKKDQPVEEKDQPEKMINIDDSPHHEPVLELETGTFPAATESETGNDLSETPSRTDLLVFDYDSETDEKSVYNNASAPVNINTNSQSELIDRFILANPRIEPVKEKTDQPVYDISKHGKDEKESFITETLAKIYIKQEYYSRAIDIYETLSLNFPEKSSYFATQIEKIKELIKQK